MRHLIFILAAASALAVVDRPLGIGTKGPASAWGAENQLGSLPQVVLTQKKIDDLIAVQREMAASANGPRADNLDIAGIARKHGFEDFDEWAAVSWSVAVVMIGIDPATKTWVGPARARALLGSAAPFGSAAAPPAGNIPLVIKNFDELGGSYYMLSVAIRMTLLNSDRFNWLEEPRAKAPGK